MYNADRMAELEYRTEERAPREVVLEADEAQCTLTLPLPPGWLAVLGIGMGFALGGMYLVGMAYVAVRFRTAMRAAPVLWIHVVIGLCWVGAAGAWLRSHLRYGHLPSVWVVNRSLGTLAVRAARSGRWRTWGLERVTTVKMTRFERVHPKAHGVSVFVRVRGRVLPVVVQFGWRDLAVAEQFAAYLRRAARLPGEPDGTGSGMWNAEERR
jgi:hypothetical protein